MHKYCGYDAFIATYIQDDYVNLKYVPGLRIEAVKKITGIWVIDSSLWLMRNAKKIDVLNIYHLVFNSVIHTALVRIFNHKGKVYLKCDGAPTKNYWKTVRHKFRGFITCLLGRFMMKKVDLVSTELIENVDMLNHEWGINSVFVPNPLNPSELSDSRPFSKRSNVILTVGRIGSHQKASEILLEAFAKIHSQIPDWTLKLAGQISENLNIAKDFYSSHPELKDKVIFTGNITDRKELAELYDDSKIFAFPSRHESFGIAVTEAMSHGCFLVASNIPSSQSLTENFKYALGFDVEDIDGLAEKLLYSCTHEHEIENLAVQARQATLNRCSLESVSKTIYQHVK